MFVLSSHQAVAKIIKVVLSSSKKEKLYALNFYMDLEVFLFDWDSLHGKLNSTTRHGFTRKEAQKRLQITENLFRKNLQLKYVC